MISTTFWAAQIETENEHSCQWLSVHPVALAEDSNTLKYASESSSAVSQSQPWLYHHCHLDIHVLVSPSTNWSFQCWLVSAWAVISWLIMMTFCCSASCCSSLCCSSASCCCCVTNHATQVFRVIPVVLAFLDLCPNPNGVVYVIWPAMKKHTWQVWINTMRRWLSWLLYDHQLFHHHPQVLYRILVSLLYCHHGDAHHPSLPEHLPHMGIRVWTSAFCFPCLWTSLVGKPCVPETGTRTWSGTRWWALL